MFTVRKGAPFLILNKNDYIETINANIDIGNHQVHILVEQNPLHPLSDSRFSLSLCFLCCKTGVSILRLANSNSLHIEIQ